MHKIQKLWLYLYPDSLVWQRSITISIAVVLAIFCDHYYSLMHQGWIPIASILIMQLTFRNNLRQILERSFLVFIFIFILSLFSVWLQKTYLILFFVFSTVILIYGLYSQNFARKNNFPLPLLFVVITILMVIPYAYSGKIYDKMHDVVLGCIISVGASLFIFPRRADVDFRKGIIPVLEAYIHYFTSILALLLRTQESDHLANQARIAVENVLQTQQAYFPDWVYEYGFNLELQQGHRHFLVKVEHLGQILFAMHQIARHDISKDLLEEFREPIERFIKKANLLLELFIVRLNLKKVEDVVDDFSQDISLLEETFRRVINVPLELLDSSPDNMDIAALIYDLKDFQKTLISLAEALR